LDFELEVELLEPVKEVRRGTLSLSSPTKVERDAKGEEIFERLDYGGLLWYRTEEGERIMSGFVRSSNSGNLALLNLLLAGKRVIVNLHGHNFYYREARIRSTGWYTEGHPSYEGEPGGAEGECDTVH
jgi:CRP-like cAMP-binding protein